MRLLTILFLIGASLVACNNKSSSYDINNHFTQDEQDTLLTNIMIYIYKTPRGVRKENKFESEFRPLYASQLNEFKMLEYHIDEDSTHYFYMLRPARNAEGHKRGVAGKYKLGPELELLDFEEIFNTPMLPEDSIITRGKFLWEDLMHYKHVDRYFMNKDYIEFPNDQCTYDKELKEWVY